ncbi:hypothetical protein CKO25_13940 [Thiocapsa imhoffii]|uniref:NADH:quinone oxidoreductase/Mrp antiporter transmembrane domain-containing protein n=1 Tax=Thiocapsa imhoffii TaxID=382777 RepID=A0A9X0WJL4_9GAMM|nr:proton-conducting transporter membrane subunit [Thiocapsa imhoffii]MBK1645731.1 hypothetical protein [Thiocapsa imhoffii]
MSLLLILAWVVPLFLTVFARRPGFGWLPAIAALPALAAALLVPDSASLRLDWLLLGSHFALDQTTRLFLLFTAILWVAAGIYASASRHHTHHEGRFNTFFLLAMTGNIWLITGQDLVSFYVGFALMGIASYGLVIHEGDRGALRAGQIYLTLTLAAEVILFLALVTIASTTGTLEPTPEDLNALDGATITLLVLGLAVKAGLLPVHVWLPLAHPAAPIAASAVLSGAMIKVALLGWLRFLPIGEIAQPDLGLFFVMMGLATALYAIPIALVQSNPKVLLAYSSVSKMGLMVLVLGLILITPALAPSATLALVLYAAHHALAKGGLFLGIGLRKHAGTRGWVFAGLLVLAFSMAAVPLTGGAVAKFGIKPAIDALQWPWLKAMIALTVIGTAWLMARFLWLLWRIEPQSDVAQTAAARRIEWALLGWWPLVFLIALYPWALGSPAAWLTDVGLILIALIIGLPVVWAARHRRALFAPLIDGIRPGDLLGPIRVILAALHFTLRHRLRRAQEARILINRRARVIWEQVLERPGDDWEQRLSAWPMAGTLWLALIVAIITLSLLIV